jgi:Zn-dependent M28 family amino/carboxypeptidase
MLHSAIASPGSDRSERLRQTVERLADIGPRNIHHYPALQEAAEFCANQLKLAGYIPVPQYYESRGKSFVNFSAELAGDARKDDIIVIGAHYDTHKESPGANDNGSALAVLFEVARAFAERRPARTLRFVTFTNEESPFTRSKHMGSRVYAEQCRQRRDKIIAMLCLETLGCYSEQPGTQRMSFGGWLLPRAGDFLALVANRHSKHLLQQVNGIISRETDLRTKAVTLPTHFPGAWSSDHWSFWRKGYPAIMATDTGPLRYPYYHSAEDTPDKLDFQWLGRVAAATIHIVARLCETDDSQ